MTDKCLAPICPDGMAEFTLTYEGVEMVCHFEYEPAERQTESEPGSDLLLLLQYAYVHGVNIAHLVLESAVMEIEELALIALENQDD
jgi:hypothetical protein